ncbi:MAG: phage holin [Firmicutes bacterium]|nr:phage holin [Bacillota bacterium]
MLNGILLQSLMLIIQAAILIVGVYIVQYIRLRLAKERFYFVYSLAKTVVISVEQMIGPGRGADKKQEALQVLKNLTKGKLSDEQMDRVIEAAVYEMNGMLRIDRSI